MPEPDFAAALALDYDGNGKTDLLIVTPDGGLALANRGMGTFMINDLVHRQFRSTDPRRLPFALAPGTCVAPGRLIEGETPRPNLLLLLTPDGRLFEMENTER